MNTPLRFLLAFVSGAIAVFAFPPFSWSLLVFVVWPLLFLAVRGAGFKTGVRLGVVHGLALFVIALSWLWMPFHQLSIVLWFILALFPGLACGLIGWSSKKHPLAWWLPLYVAAAWSGIEYFRSEWFYLRFPWMTPGMAVGPTWLSPVVGVYGVGFVVVLMAAFVVFGRTKWRLAGLPVLALVMTPFPSPIYEAGQPVAVLAVQNENSDFSSYRSASESSGFRDGVILWPEYSAPFDMKPGHQEWDKVMELATDRNATVVFGSIKALPNEKHYNIARTMDATGEVGWHAKNRPVHFMDDGVAGTETVPVVTKFGTLGTPICFDCDYTEVVRRMVDAGAQAFVVPSMDVKTWSAREHLQHAELFRLRAAETGRWFAVASSSGMTQFIDPRGHRVKALPLMDDGILRGSVYLRTDKTIFVCFGWMFPWLVLGSAVFATIALMTWRSEKPVVA